MKITLKIEKEYEAKFLRVCANVRYWNDGKINGVEDENGLLTPFNIDGSWCPLIDIDNGKIIDWPKGITADLHYKVCDDGKYDLLDENKKEIIEIDGYVPDIMCPKGGGYGDYIIMNIDEEGKIENWNKSEIEDFN